jgi:hypothetical protein
MGKEGGSELKSLLDEIEKKLVEEESLQTLKAIAVLAAMGTPEARELLSRLATGAAGSRITESARQPLPRTAKCPRDRISGSNKGSGPRLRRRGATRKA